MANYATLKAAIQDVVKTNGNNEITGALLQQSLLAMINSLGNGFQYAGIALPTTNPGTPDQNVFYIAPSSGAYSNFNSIVVADGEIAILKYNGSWVKDSVKVVSIERVDKIASVVGSNGDAVTLYPSAFSGLVCTGTTVVAASSTYDSFVIPVTPGVRYTFTGVISSKFGFANYPKIGDTPTQTGVYSETMIPDPGVNYVLVNVQKSVSSISYSSDSFGLVKDVADLQEYLNGSPSVVITASANVGTVNTGIPMDVSQYVGRRAHLTFSGAGATFIPLQNNYIGMARLTQDDVLDIIIPAGFGVSAYVASGTLDVSVTITIEAAPQPWDEQQYNINAVTLLDGYYYNTGGNYNGTPAALAGYSGATGKLKYGDALRLTGQGGSNIVATVAFFNAAGNMILRAAQGEMTDITIFAPQNCAYYSFNSRNSKSPSLSVLSALDLGKLTTQVETLQQDVQELQDIAQDWGDKTIVCLGDSITEFSYNGKRYSDYLHDITGATVINGGIGGTRIQERTTPTSSPSSSLTGYAGLDLASIVKAFCTNDFTIVDACAEWVKNNESDDNTPIIARIKAINWAAVNVITIFAGTNDWGATVGTSGSEDPLTTLGAINYIIKLINTTYPHIRIYWFTPIPRYVSNIRDSEHWSSNYSYGGKTLKELAALIQTEVVNNNIPVCDMYNTFGITQSNFSAYFNDNDGTHPYKAFLPIAEKIRGFMSSNMTF